MKKIVLRLLLLFMFTGCGGPEFTNPLTAFSEKEQDSSLIGIWIPVEDKESPPGFVIIGYDRNKEYLRIQITGLSGEGKLESDEVIAHCSVLNKKRYLNARMVNDGKPAKRHNIYKYRVQDDVLSFSLMEDDIFAKAIKSGAIKGKVVKQKFWPRTVYVTDSQKKIQKFVMEKDENLFTKFQKLKRYSPGK